MRRGNRDHVTCTRSKKLYLHHILYQEVTETLLCQIREGTKEEKGTRYRRQEILLRREVTPIPRVMMKEKLKMYTKHRGQPVQTTANQKAPGETCSGT